jgi:hypothetical protein
MIGGSSPGRGWEFFSSPPRPDRLRGPPSLLFNGYQGLFPWEVKRPWCESDHSPPSSTEIKNEWSYTSAPQYAFMAWCSVKIKHSDNFTFYLNEKVKITISANIHVAVITEDRTVGPNPALNKVKVKLSLCFY